MVELNDEELLLRLKNFEDNFVERKTSGDSGDWLKTVVGFANSTPIGYSAVLFIGANNDGTPQEKTVDLDSLQKTISKKVSEAYPPVYYLTKIVNVEAKQVLAVIVPGSPERPHFAGPAYIREGSKSVMASRAQFEELIASRNSKVYEILKWKGKIITLDLMSVPTALNFTGAVVASQAYRVVDCNQFYVTVDQANFKKSMPLDRVNISFDQSAQRLKLEERQL